LLPTLYAVAIRLRDAGFDDEVISVAVGIGARQVPTLFQLAESKLESLMSAPGEADSQPVISDA